MNRLKKAALYLVIVAFFSLPLVAAVIGFKAQTGRAWKAYYDKVEPPAPGFYESRRKRLEQVRSGQKTVALNRLPTTLNFCRCLQRLKLGVPPLFDQRKTNGGPKTNDDRSRES